MVEDERAPLVIRITEREYWQLRIEWACGTNEIRARANPINLAVRKELAAILADGLLFRQLKKEAAFLFGNICVCLLHRLDDAALHLVSEGLVKSISMQHHRAWGMVCVGAINQNICSRNACVLFDVRNHRIEMLAFHHQDIAG